MSGTGRSLPPLTLSLSKGEDILRCSCFDKLSTNDLHPRRGFTLVEILVSVAILSIGAIVVMQALGRAAEAVVIAENRKEATLFAASKMAEVELALRKGQELEEHTAGSFQIDQQRYEWSLVSSIDPSDDPRRKSILLTVRWNDGRHPYEYRLGTVLKQIKERNEAKG